MIKISLDRIDAKFGHFKRIEICLCFQNSQPLSADVKTGLILSCACDCMNCSILTLYVNTTISMSMAKTAKLSGLCLSRQVIAIPIWIGVCDGQ